MRANVVWSCVRKKRLDPMRRLMMEVTKVLMEAWRVVVIAASRRGMLYCRDAD
jgi:hypothetical protein